MHDKTELLGVKGSWREVVDDCRATVGKESLGHEPSEQFKRNILIAEHSPIRDIRVRWRWRFPLRWRGRNARSPTCGSSYRLCSRRFRKRGRDDGRVEFF